MSLAEPVGQRRHVGWPATLGVLAGWVGAGLIGAFVAYAVGGSADDAYNEVGGALVHEALPALFGLCLIVAAISALHWWPAALRDDLPTRAWAWLFPVGMLLAPVLLLDWDRLGDAGGALIGVLAVSVVLVAASEELTFRGFTLVSMRDKYPELGAAVVTTLLFAAAHMLNGGLGNIAQAALNVLAGFLYYVIRRVTRGIAVPIALHAWWDFCVFSGELGPGANETSSLFEAAAALLTLFVIALAGYRLWQPRG